ncbi:hypothetical protein BJV82DRAFT_523697 [Fennellomyces sp. T-0311]|nr:hypothetical protein BJV82DRAFT_523697 [Fennellomyces sp. T-0311]
MPELVLPSTEHIKQLIEIAKRHLALREQQQESKVPQDKEAQQQQLQQQQQQQQPKEQEISQHVSLAAGAEEAMTLEAYAESDGIDIKKLTPKERRQLRNKISARNFRVRRKEYITTLEAQVDDHKKHAERLQTRLDDVEEENKQLRLEVDSLRRQNQLLQQGKSVAGPSSPGSPRVSSPIPKPNLNKDISMLGSKASETYRHDTRILVSNAVMPVWDFDRIFTAQQQPPPPPPTTRCPTILAPPPEPIMHDEKCNAASPTSASPAYMEYLYDTLIMSALTTNARTHKSFWWWDTPAFHP